MNHSAAPTVEEVCSFLANEKRADRKIQLLQRFIVEPPCEFTRALLDVVDELRLEKDPGIRFWAKKVYGKYVQILGAEGGETAANAQTAEAGEVSLDLLLKKLHMVKKSRFNAIQVLQRICQTKNPAALEPMMNYLKACNDEFQISYLTKNLGIHFPSDTLLPVLCNFLTHRDPRVIANTIEGIEAIGSPKSFAVCARFINHANNRVRANAAKALSRYDAEKAEEIILKMLVHPQPHINISGCFAAKELKRVKFLPSLKELLNNDLVIDDALSAIVATDQKEGYRLLQDASNRFRLRQEKVEAAIRQNFSFLKRHFTGVEAPPAAAPKKEEAAGIGLDTPLLPAGVWSSMKYGAAAVLVCIVIGAVFMGMKPPLTGRDEAIKKLEEMRLSFTPDEFIRCMETNRLKEVEYFIRAGMDVNQRTSNQATPLHFGAYFGNASLVKMLIEAKANVNLQDNKGLAPLHLASNQEIADLLIGAGATREIRDNYGKTPLLKAIESGAFDVASYLVNHGANVNAQDNEGNTPLHIAAFTNQKNVLPTLLAKGANRDIRNKSKVSPRDLGI